MIKKVFLPLFSFIAIISILLGMNEWKKKRDLQQEQQTRKRKYEVFQILSKAFPLVKKRWKYGDHEGFYEKRSFSCPKEISFNPNVDTQYLKCNPNYMQCFLEGKAGIKNPVFKVYLNRKPYTVRANPVFETHSFYSQKKRFYKIITRNNTKGENIPSYGIQLNLSVDSYPEFSIDVILEDSCHDIYLPQDTYALGHYPDHHPERDWIWDNKNRHVYIDQHLVTFRDFIEWQHYGKEAPKIHIPKDRGEWAYPVTGLSKKDMKNYCAFKGKQLLQAHYFDAGTFMKIAKQDEEIIKEEEQPHSYLADDDEEFEEDIDDNNDDEQKITQEEEKLENSNDRPEDFYQGQELGPDHQKNDGPGIKRGPYPWTKRSKDFIQDYIFEKTQFPGTILFKDECKLVYSKECFSVFPYKAFSSHSSSWIGLSEILGGYLEAMENPLYENKNLKASSFYFEISSFWHQLGMRAFWDGIDFYSKNFSWSNDLYLAPQEKENTFFEYPEHPRETFKVGFRCMKFEGGY